MDTVYDDGEYYIVKSGGRFSVHESGTDTFLLHRGTLDEAMESVSKLKGEYTGEVSVGLGSLGEAPVETGKPEWFEKVKDIQPMTRLFLGGWK